MNKKIKNKKRLIWASISIVIVALAVAGIFGNKYYQNYKADKIYNVNESVGFPDFYLKVAKAEFKPVNLPLDQKTIDKYGAIDKPENCNTLSKKPTIIILGSLGNPTYAPYGPSDYNICIRRNDSRKEIRNYNSLNKQLNVDFVVNAKNNTKSSNIKLILQPDSGRKLSKKVNSFNANQFFEGGAQEKDTSGITDAPGPFYSSEFPQKYIPYHASNLGGDINKGLARTGYIYTDIRNSEKTVDLKITYKKDGQTQTRIIRITR